MLDKGSSRNNVVRVYIRRNIVVLERLERFACPRGVYVLDSQSLMNVD
jgi:hypothetical protein